MLFKSNIDITTCMITNFVTYINCDTYLTLHDQGMHAYILCDIFAMNVWICNEYNKHAYNKKVFCEKHGILF